MPTPEFEVLSEELAVDVGHTKNNVSGKKAFGKQMYYPSNTPDTNIVNAMTGVKYPYKVGTFESLRLYSVIDATTMCDNKGVRIKSTDMETETGRTNYLYYDSPQQYMQHRKVTLDPEVVLKWRKRVMELFPSTDETENSGAFNREVYDRFVNQHTDKMQMDFKSRLAKDAMMRMCDDAENVLCVDEQ